MRRAQCRLILVVDTCNTRADSRGRDAEAAQKAGNHPRSSLGLRVPGSTFSVALPPVNGPTCLLGAMGRLLGGMTSSGVMGVGPSPCGFVERETPGGGPEAGAVEPGVP